MFVLENDCLDELVEIIRLEYVREESLNFFQTLCTVIPDEHEMCRIKENAIPAFIMLVVDNVLKFISTDNVNSFVNGISNGTLGMMMDVSYSHVRELVGDYADVLEQQGYQDYVRKQLGLYIQDIYQRNAQELNLTLLAIMEKLYPKFHYLGRRVIRSGLIHNKVPVVFVAEGGN